MRSSWYAAVLTIHRARGGPCGNGIAPSIGHTQTTCCEHIRPHRSFKNSDINCMRTVACLGKTSRYMYWKSLRKFSSERQRSSACRKHITSHTSKQVMGLECDLSHEPHARNVTTQDCYCRLYENRGHDPSWR